MSFLGVAYTHACIIEAKEEEIRKEKERIRELKISIFFYAIRHKIRYNDVLTQLKNGTLTIADIAKDSGENESPGSEVDGDGDETEMESEGNESEPGAEETNGEESAGIEVTVDVKIDSPDIEDVMNPPEGDSGEENDGGEEEEEKDEQSED